VKHAAWWVVAIALPLLLGTLLSVPYEYVTEAVNWAMEGWDLQSAFLSTALYLSAPLVIALAFFGITTFVAVRAMRTRGAAPRIGWAVGGVGLVMGAWSVVSMRLRFLPDLEFANSPYFLIVAASPGIAIFAGAFLEQLLLQHSASGEGLGSAEVPPIE
jgi:hypothetical protein